MTQRMVTMCTAMLAVVSGRTIANSLLPRQNSHAYTPSARPLAGIFPWDQHKLTSPAPPRRKRPTPYRLPPTARTIPIRAFRREWVKVSASDLGCAALAAIYGLQKLRPGITPLLYKCNEGLAKGQLHRLVTSGLLHGSTMHLAVNTWSLSNIGPSCERWFGKPRFGGVVLASCVGAALLSWKFVPGPSLGASGAVFGLLGAWAVFLAENREVLGRESTNRGLDSIARTIGMNAALGFFIPGIDHFGHAGGFLAGAACGFLVGPRLRVRERTAPNGFVYDRVLVDYPRLPSVCRDMVYGAEWLKWQADKFRLRGEPSVTVRQPFHLV